MTDNSPTNIESDDELIDEMEPGELSLAELSEAYASVLKQNESGHSQPHDEATNDDGENAEIEPESDHTDAEVPAREKHSLTIQQMDAADNASCPISPESIVESILFVGAPAGEKLSLKKIAAVMRDVSPKEVKKTVEVLNRKYADRNSAFRIVEDAGNFKMQLCEEMAEVQNYYFGRNKAAKLSQGAIDVLAVVAYHQPITKLELEKIHKKPAGSILSQLQRRNLVSVCDEAAKKKEKQYQTTDRFLELFGLESLKDLPQTSAVTDLEELTDY